MTSLNLGKYRQPYVIFSGEVSYLVAQNTVILKYSYLRNMTPFHKIFSAAAKWLAIPVI